MKSFFFLLIGGFFLLPALVSAQTVSYSDYERDDGRDMNFEIIGKMNGNFLVYKNMRWKHKLCVFDNNMDTKAIINLDFLPDKTLNVDFITYPDFFYMVYQYQKRNIIHCLAVKMDGEGKKLGEPVELDTTQIPLFSENKIYSIINSEDKQKLMVFKMQKKNEKLFLVTLLFDDKLQLLNKSRMTVPYNERRDNYGDFLLDNEGNLITTLATEPFNKDYSNELSLITKAPLKDSLEYHDINLNKFYIDNVKLKVDNLNKRYIINSFVYKKNRGSVEGLLSCSWDKIQQRVFMSGIINFSDSLRADARRDGQLRNAFDEFVIRQVIVRKDGGFLLVTEDFSSQSNNINNPNQINRWNNSFYPYTQFSNSPYSLYPNSYYSYNPYYNSYYRPMSSYNNQNVRYYYDNIVVFNMNKEGNIDWTKVIHKDQMDDNDDNFLSYSIMNSGGEIHFLFNMDRNNQIITDQSLAPNGQDTRNATLKSQEKGYQFMTKLSKQVGSRQLLIPCLYRGYICFAKVDL